MGEVFRIEWQDLGTEPNHTQKLMILEICDDNKNEVHPPFPAQPSSNCKPFITMLVAVMASCAPLCASAGTGPLANEIGGARLLQDPGLQRNCASMAKKESWPSSLSALERGLASKALLAGQTTALAFPEGPGQSESNQLHR